mmetsp:Transcript_20976/g.80897  ORF Transcript_20976/g.80897 Transcript_20976/m.80897 type:complete len:200 (-) Transcript_20976:1590-2189(-)
MLCSGTSTSAVAISALASSSHASARIQLRERWRMSAMGLLSRPARQGMACSAMMAFLNSSSLHRQIQPSKLRASGRVLVPPTSIWRRIMGTTSKSATAFFVASPSKHRRASVAQTCILASWLGLRNSSISAAIPPPRASFLAIGLTLLRAWRAMAADHCTLTLGDLTKEVSSSPVSSSGKFWSAMATMGSTTPASTIFS